MQGLLVFPTLEEAIRAGFTLYDRTPSGYLVRAQTSKGYALAIARASGKNR